MDDDVWIAIIVSMLIAPSMAVLVAICIRFMGKIIKKSGEADEFDLDLMAVDYAMSPLSPDNGPIALPTNFSDRLIEEPNFKSHNCISQYLSE